MNMFLKRLALLTSTIGATGAVFFILFFKAYYFSLFPFVLLFFFLFTWMSHAIQIKRIKNSFSEFARMHMVFTMLRLFLYTAMIVLYLIFSDENIASFIIVVVLFYIVFTTFEVRELTAVTKGLRKNDK